MSDWREAPAVTDAARRELDRWRAACIARPGALPPGCEVVQRRIVRVVGRGELPDVGSAYVKVMAFPRAKDRLRYAFRVLPGRHEARLLRRVREVAPDQACPEVLDVVERRAWGLPALSVLVTRGLPVDPGVGPPTLLEMAAAARRLADVGIEHVDLNHANFVRLRDGQVGVLDLQSARIRRRPVSSNSRAAMAAKLLEFAPEGQGPVVVEAGLVPPDALAGVEARAIVLRQRALSRQILRCFRESTEFTVAVRWNGLLFRRRHVRETRGEVSGGRELHGLWLGDRALEVLDGKPPLLSGYFHKWWWLPGRSRLYTAAPYTQEDLEQRRGELLRGRERWAGIRSAR